MSATSKTTVRQKKRNSFCFEPKHTGELIAAELKGRNRRKEKAALRRLLEEAVYQMLGPRYPKLMAGIDVEKIFGGSR